MQAVIKVAGKQYKIKEGERLKIDKILGELNKKVTFDEVLLVFDNKKINIGQPKLKGVKVEAKVLKQGRDKKITIFKFKSKTRYRRKKGHRQPYTLIEIEKIKKADK